MATVGQLVVNLLGNTAPFKRAFAEIPGFLGGITGRVAGLLGAGGGIASIGTGVKLAADAEQMQVAFETMLGSAERAKTMLAELREYAMRSPFSQIATVENAQLLLNYGVAADSILPTMRMLGDIAAGDQNKLQGLSVAFGQMSATGRLMGQDLNQMINAGFNPLQEVSKRTGESMGALKARMEAGAVGIEEVRQAMVDATSQGGRFYNMTERQSATLTGRFSSMKDEISDTLRTIGQMLIDTFDFRGQVEAAGNTLADFRAWITASGHDVIIFAGAVFGFVAALSAVRTAIQAATIATAIWKSISSPAGFAMVAAGILGAAAAVAGLEEMFDASSQRAIELSKNAAAATSSIRDMAAAGKAGMDSGGSSSAFQKAIDNLARIRQEMQSATGNNYRRLQGEEAAAMSKVDSMSTFKDQADKAAERIGNLHDMLRAAKGAADQLGESRAGELAYEIERQIGLVSGFTDKMHKLDQSIAGMSRIDIEAQELSQVATPEQVAAFRAKAEQDERLKQLRSARDQLAKQVESPSEAFKKQLQDLHDMRKQGLIDEETFSRGKELAAKDYAKDEMAKDGGNKERQSRPLEALLRDSKAAQDAIARGMMSGKDNNPNRKMESLSERTAKAVEKGNTILAEIAAADPEPTEVVDF